MSWYLTPIIIAKSLDKRLYWQNSRKSSVLSITPEAVEISVVHRRPRRPNFPLEFKSALMGKSMVPGVSVAQLARENDINDCLLFNWRRLYQQLLLGLRPARQHCSP
ncbi:transposase [Pantoea ananatis]|uniref:transposase n=1 Tax=Pantoea ananas TaxID=553 RepID=UPI003AB9431A